MCYGVFGSKTIENWSWFFIRFHQAIGSPPGLVILIDAGKRIDSAVTQMFKNGLSIKRNEKSLNAGDLMDSIRQLCMEKMFLRRKIARKLEGKILPNVMKDLNTRSRGLKYMWRYSHKDGATHAEMLGQVEGVTRDLIYWRHTVDLQERTCTCRHRQVTGLSCTHTLCIITSTSGYNIEDYVNEYYSIAKFNKAYRKS